MKQRGLCTHPEKKKNAHVTMHVQIRKEWHWKNMCACKKIPKWRPQEQRGVNTQQKEDNVRQTGIKTGGWGRWEKHNHWSGKTNTEKTREAIQKDSVDGRLFTPGEQQRMNIPTLHWSEFCAVWNYIVLIDGTWLVSLLIYSTALAQITSEGMRSICSRLLLKLSWNNQHSGAHGSKQLLNWQ